MVMLITDRKQISFCFDGSEGERVNKCMKVQNFLRFGGGMLKHMNVLMSGLICQIQRHKPCLHTEVLSHVKSRQQGCAVTKKTKKGIEQSDAALFVPLIPQRSKRRRCRSFQTCCGFTLGPGGNLFTLEVVFLSDIQRKRKVYPQQIINCENLKRGLINSCHQAQKVCYCQLIYMLFDKIVHRS